LGGDTAVYLVFFPIIDTCLRCEDIVDRVVRWCTDGEFWRFFLRPVFSAIRVQYDSDLHPKFALKATPCVEVW